MCAIPFRPTLTSGVFGADLNHPRSVATVTIRLDDVNDHRP